MRRKSFAMNPEDSQNFLTRLKVKTDSNDKSSSKRISELKLPPIHKTALTHGIGNEEDLGFSRPNEEDKEEVYRNTQNQPESSSSSSSSKSSGSKEKEPEMYDDDLKQKLRYEQIITLSFWLSIDLGRLEIANMILEQDELMQKLVANLYSNASNTKLNTVKSAASGGMSKKIKTNSPPKNDYSEFSRSKGNSK